MLNDCFCYFAENYGPVFKTTGTSFFFYNSGVLFCRIFFCLCEFSDRGLPAKTTKKLKPFKIFLAIRKRKKFVKKARNGKRIKSS